MGDSELLITIAELGSAVGTNGEVRLVPITDFPDRFQGMDTVLVVQGEQKRLLHISAVSCKGNKMTVKFGEIDTIEEARKLKGAYLKVPHSQLVSLQPGQYYIFQLIGLPVFEGETYLGNLESILNTGSNDVYVVRNDQTGKEILIPALKQVVTSIDLDKQVIRVQLPEGLRD